MGIEINTTETGRAMLWLDQVIHFNETEDGATTVLMAGSSYRFTVDVHYEEFKKRVLE